MSIKAAPWSSIYSTCVSMELSSLYFPPSKKESGVRLRMPITLGDVRSTSSPLQFMVIRNICFVGFHYLWQSAFGHKQVGRNLRKLATIHAPYFPTIRCGDTDLPGIVFKKGQGLWHCLANPSVTLFN